jgi:sialate O-acetylesterase
MRKVSVIILCFFLSSISVLATVKLPDIFGDNMVLQQKADVAIWGQASPGATVFVIPSWDKKRRSTQADKNGKWRLKISTISAGGPYTMEISDGKAVQIHNILLGEVWLCSGQSNMTMSLKGWQSIPVEGAMDEIVLAKSEKIRFFDVAQGTQLLPQDEVKGKWKEVSPETLAEFSATAWFFGKMLQNRLDIPVGLITTSWGGSTIEAWMSEETLKPFENIRIPRSVDSIKAPNQTPTILYNNMLYPVEGYGIRGCIWYQGESNVSNPRQYPALMEAMVKSWRAQWGEGDFPFYYVQIAPFNYLKYFPEGAKGISSAYLREAQSKALTIIPNSGMAVLMDVGEENSIHPRDKKTPGHRLAYLALSRTYGIKGFIGASPGYKAMKVKGNLVTLTFTDAGEGLTSWGKELKEFEVAGADKKFYPANAVIKLSEVELSSPQVDNPIAVRYAFKDFVTGDLFSNGGLPVSSFRTDDWPIGE